MQGRQGMEETGVRARPRPTRAKSHKEGSLLDLPHSRPQASFTPARSACPALGQPRALQVRSPSPPPASAREAGSFASNASASPPAPENPPPATPLSYPQAGALQPPYLAAAAARPQPSSPLGAGADARSSRSAFTPHLSPAPLSFQKGNERRPATTGSRELESLSWRRQPCQCGAFREHAQQLPSRGGRADRQQRPFWCGAPGACALTAAVREPTAGAAAIFVRGVRLRGRGEYVAAIFLRGKATCHPCEWH